MKILIRAGFVVFVGVIALLFAIVVAICVFVSPVQVAVYYIFTGKCLGIEYSALDWSLNQLMRFFSWMDDKAVFKKN